MNMNIRTIDPSDVRIVSTEERKSRRERLGLDPSTWTIPSSEIVYDVQAELRRLRMEADRQWQLEATERFMAQRKAARDMMRIASVPSGEPVPFRTPTVRLRRIMYLVAKMHGFTVDEIKGHQRNQKLVNARHQAILLTSIFNGKWSLPRIGRAFDRDHTSILYALRMVKARRQAKREARS